MKYHVVYSYNSIHDSNVEEQGAIECRNLIHAAFTYICAYYGAIADIEPAAIAPLTLYNAILCKRVNLKIGIAKY